MSSISVVAFTFLVSVLIVALRNQIFQYLRICFCRRALGYLEPVVLKKVSSCRNAWSLLTFLEDCCGLWRESFGR